MNSFRELGSVCFCRSFARYGAAECGRAVTGGFLHFFSRGKLLDSVDKNRAAYLKFYTGQVFGKAENYNLCVDSGKLGIENTVQIIEAAWRGLLCRTEE